MYHLFWGRLPKRALCSVQCGIKHLSVINGSPVDPPKARFIWCALEIADRIPRRVLGQKQTVSDHQTLRLTAEDADLGSRLNFQANPHSK